MRSLYFVFNFLLEEKLRVFSRQPIIIIPFFILSLFFAFFYDTLVIHGDFLPQTFYSKEFPQRNRVRVTFLKLNGQSDYFTKVKFKYIDNGVESIKFNGFDIKETKTKVRGVIVSTLFLLSAEKVKEGMNALEISLRGPNPRSVDIWVSNFRKNLEDDVYIINYRVKFDLSLLRRNLSGWPFWFIAILSLWIIIRYIFSKSGLGERRASFIVFLSLGVFLALLFLIYLGCYLSGYLIKISFQYLVFLYLFSSFPILLIASRSAIFKFFLDFFTSIKEFIDTAPTFLGKIAKIIVLLYNYCIEIMFFLFLFFLSLACFFLIFRFKDAAEFAADVGYFTILAAVFIQVIKISFRRDSK